jgi:DNA-binding MarR family transcriptional regulator
LEANTTANGVVPGEMTMDDREELIKRVNAVIRKIAMDGIGQREAFAEVLYLRTGVRIPPGAFRVLDEVQQNSMRVTDLASILRESIHTTARQVRELEAKGLLVRVKDDTDARASIVSLSPLGQQVVVEMWSERLRYMSNHLKSWSSDRLQRLLPELTLLATDLTPKADTYGIEAQWDYLSGRRGE